MEFRAPSAAAQLNARGLAYLTKNLSNPEQGCAMVRHLFETLGNCVDAYPDWHPILTLPQQRSLGRALAFSDLKAYKGADHTVEFVRGFVTCPYSEQSADSLVSEVEKYPGLSAFRLEGPLYMDNAYPVVVLAENVELEADGTIRSRDVLAWFVQQCGQEALLAQVAETWWNIRSNILGSPHGSRSSLFVNQHAGAHMRKILEAMNASGMFGPIKEVSLDMLPTSKRSRIAETLLRSALGVWDKKSNEFQFELRGETCKTRIRDTWDDGYELSLRVEIGKFDLVVSGFYYPQEDHLTHVDPIGKRALAEKFV
jgi:hypothetical protein